MGGIIVENYVNRLVGGEPSIDHAQKTDELLMSVLLHIASFKSPRGRSGQLRVSWFRYAPYQPFKAKAVRRANGDENFGTYPRDSQMRAEMGILNRAFPPGGDR
jgi:hypothetical protein